MMYTSGAGYQHKIGILLLVTFFSACSGGSNTAPPPVADCNPVTGLSAPVPTCSMDNVCTNVAPELGIPTLDTSSVMPLCQTTEAGRPVFDDGPSLQLTDSNGVTRYACLYSPPAASALSKRPLVIWLHGGGGGTADDVYNFTSLRAKAVSYDLVGEVDGMGDPVRPGFFLLSIQGRNLQYPTEAPRDGHHHDFYYRDLATPSTNPDIANVDRLIDDLVTGGAVDTQRIYLMGWSNGAFFSQMYLIARQNSPTPGGNAPAAAVAFTGADPFHNTRNDQMPSCQLDPYPVSQAPIFLLTRACDIVACDAAQAAGLESQGISISPGHIAEHWFNDIQTRVSNPNMSWRIVSGTGATVTSCTAPQFCTAAIATVNHLRWPDGVADGSGIDHEPDMLDFLKANPLP